MPQSLLSAFPLDLPVLTSAAYRTLVRGTNMPYMYSCPAFALLKVAFRMALHGTHGRQSDSEPL